MTIAADKCVSAVLAVIDYCDCYFACRCKSVFLFPLPSSVTVQWQLNRAFTSSPRQVLLFFTAVLASIEASSRRIDSAKANWPFVFSRSTRSSTSFSLKAEIKIQLTRVRHAWERLCPSFGAPLTYRRRMAQYLLPAPVAHVVCFFTNRYFGRYLSLRSANPPQREHTLSKMWQAPVQ